jgi:glycosyltransferase involved in cell wall biosynthesis
VLSQTFQDFEVIVVDDGSTDGTAAMLRAEFGGQIRIESLPRNLGRSVARNVGWALAEGEFVAFLDSDDLWLPEKLARQVPGFEDSDVALVHCRVGKTDCTGERLETESRELEQEFEIAEERGYGYGGITQTWCRMYTSAVVIRTSMLRESGGFDPRLSNFEDWDLLWRIARMGKVETVPETLVLHRTHAGNTATVWNEDAEPWLAVNRKHLAELDGFPRGPEERIARGNLLVNMALGEYWRRNLGASRRWMLRAIASAPRILARPGHYVWCAPLLHALLPHFLAQFLIDCIGPDRYLTPERQVA